MLLDILVLVDTRGVDKQGQVEGKTTFGVRLETDEYPHWKKIGFNIELLKVIECVEAIKYLQNMTEEDKTDATT